MGAEDVTEVIFESRSKGNEEQASVLWEMRKLRLKTQGHGTSRWNSWNTKHPTNEAKNEERIGGGKHLLHKDEALSFSDSHDEEQDHKKS